MTRTLRSSSPVSAGACKRACQISRAALDTQLETSMESVDTPRESTPDGVFLAEPPRSADERRAFMTVSELSSIVRSIVDR